MTRADERRLAAHCAALSACRLCGLGDGVAPIVSHARRPRAMLVGQAPGQVEAAGGRPFAGRAGRTLFRWFERIGLDEPAVRSTIYIAAVTRCYPGPSGTGRGDRVPSRQEQAACARWLDAELEIIRPRLIIPVGRLAIDRFLPAAPLAELIGRSFDFMYPGGVASVIPLPHPSGASSWIHQKAHAALLDRALRAVGRALERSAAPAPRGRDGGRSTPSPARRAGEPAPVRGLY